METWVRIAILVPIVVVVVGVFWWSTRVPVNPDANHDRWKDPDQGGGTG